MAPQNISLIGMSNIGKSHWSNKLADFGFTPFRCDDLIERNLEPRLRRQRLKGIGDVARWMGQPHEPHYPENSALYLKAEAAVMNEIIRKMREGNGRFAVDTTGSVIYLGEEILAKLRELSTVVLLNAPESHQELLFQKYCAEPKPVIWGNMYKPLPGEDVKDALARCYPLLLKSRNELYRRHAHAVLDYDTVRAPGFDGKEFLEKVESRRPPFYYS